MSENYQEVDAELDELIGKKNGLRYNEDGSEHRLPGRDKDGNFKKGVSGNPNGRPKKPKKPPAKKPDPKKDEKKKPEVNVDFVAAQGQTVADSVELNAANLMNACFQSIQKGNPKLTEIFFSQALKDKGQGQNPFAGLGDLEDVDPSELLELSERISEGEIDV